MIPECPEIWGCNENQPMPWISVVPWQKWLIFHQQETTFETTFPKNFAKSPLSSFFERKNFTSVMKRARESNIIEYQCAEKK